MIPLDQTELQIGEVASRTGVSIDTLRYYERLKLLPRARRSSGGFRLFTGDHVERVQFIKQAQELGFSLDEIKGLLATGGADECRKVRNLLRLKLSELDDRLKAMKGFRGVLARQLAACDEELKQHGESACCPVVVISHTRNAPKASSVKGE
ncbi:MAG TPA: heavy metal-responsive transcriptional regulator [Pyrinomonadaceae bacterium]|nr:heavy metal-responsive transcriptional regulator [Pyrinomonadaceae bacterium]